MKTIQRTPVDDPSDSLPEKHLNYNNGTVSRSFFTTEKLQLRWDEAKCKPHELFSMMQRAGNRCHFLKRRWVSVAIKVTSSNRPTKASRAARTVRGSSSPMPPSRIMCKVESS